MNSKFERRVPNNRLQKHIRNFPNNSTYLLLLGRIHYSLLLKLFWLWNSESLTIFVVSKCLRKLIEFNWLKAKYAWVGQFSEGSHFFEGYLNLEMASVLISVWTCTVKSMNILYYWCVKSFLYIHWLKKFNCFTFDLVAKLPSLIPNKEIHLYANILIINW